MILIPFDSQPKLDLVNSIRPQAILKLDVSFKGKQKQEQRRY